MPTSVLRRAPGSPALLPSVVRRIADAMLAELDLEHAELSVLLTNDREIHSLNLQHRGKDRATDVLAFPLLASVSGKPPHAVNAAGQAAPLLGYVVISLDTAARQARGRKRELLPEVRFLLAHGLLHLIGYDHGDPQEKRVMTAMTQRLVRAVSGVPANSRQKPAPRSARPRATARAEARKPAKHSARPRARHAK
jgi:probable rRNA maturation factor